MTQDLIPDRKLGTFSRIASFVAGLMLSSYLFIWGFNYRLDLLQADQIIGQSIVFMGYDITAWITLSLVVLAGVFGGYLIQVGIRGKTGF